MVGTLRSLCGLEGPGTGGVGEDGLQVLLPLLCQADVTFSRDNLSHWEQTEPMPRQYSDLESRWEEKTLYL